MRPGDPVLGLTQAAAAGAGAANASKPGFLEAALATGYGWFRSHRGIVVTVQGTGWALLSVVVNHHSPWLVAAALLGGVVVALRAMSPGATLALAWISAVAQMAAMSGIQWLPTLAILIGLAGSTRHGSRATRRWSALSVPAGSLVATSYLTWVQGTSSLVGPSSTPTVFISWGALSLLSLGSAWLVGTLGASRDSYRRRSDEAASAEREATSARERAMLARDMHDVLAHSLSVMVALSDGTRLSTPDLPDAAKDSLSQISTVGRSALTDVRGLLARLRDSDGGQDQGLLSVDQLVTATRATGLPVSLIEDGVPPQASSSTYLTIAHVLREALTNALRHGDRGAGATVQLRWGEPVRLVVRNLLPLRPRSAQPAPHRLGLVGMRERVVSVGGTIICGRQGREWVVDVSIPAAAAVREFATDVSPQASSEGQP